MDIDAIFANKPYKHDKIDSKNEIRILELHRPNPIDPEILRGELLFAKLSDNPLYEAISYTWGEPVFSETLYLTKGQFGITPNLAAALRRFRRPDRERYLWADAVCINQEDNEEKGHQVALMAEVYRKAEHVLAWLGEGNMETTKALEILYSLVEYASWYGVDADRPWNGFVVGIRRGNSASTEFPRLLTKVERSWSSLSKFLSQTWFNRLWVIQELALASELTFYNGWHHITHHDFATATMVLFYLFDLFAPDFHGKELLLPALTLTATRWKEQRHLPETRLLALDLLELHHGREYTNDLDIIYALLGMSRRADDIQIEVDYSIGAEDLFRDFTLKYLERGHISILARAGKKPGNTRRRNAGLSNSALPTWAVDWRVSKNSRHNTLGTGSRKFNAATNTFASFALTRTLLPLIGIRGTALAIANKVVPTRCFYGAGHRESPDAFFRQKGPAAYKNLSAFLQSRATELYPTGEPADLALIRTLILDGRYGNSPAFLEGTDAFDLSRVTVLLADYVSPDADDGLILRMSGFFPGRHPALRKYLELMNEILHNRTLIESQGGYFGLGPNSMESGDLVVAFHGAETPYALRRVEAGHPNSTQIPLQEPINDFEKMKPADIKEKWELIGPCYLHGFMDNEVPQSDAGSKYFFIQ
jgi:hypothetical protein